MMEWLVPTEPGTTLIDAALQWRPHWNAAVLWFVFALAAILALWTYRSRRVELPFVWRAVLGIVRVAVFFVPLIMLMQPYVSARLERQDRRELIVLLDDSRSMTVRDGESTPPLARGEQATEALAELQTRADGATVRWYGFGGDVRSADSLEGLKALPPQDATAIGNALGEALAASKGRNIAGVVLLSDGADNASSPDRHPLTEARALAAADIPVHAVLVGSEQPRDVAVQVAADASYVFAGDPVAIEVTIEQQRFADQAVSVTLAEDERVIETRDVVLPAGGRPVVQRFTFEPGEPGEKSIRAEVTTLPGELTDRNNTATTTVDVIRDPIRLLYVEHWPRWQYQFLRNAIRRDHRFDAQLVLLTEDPATPMEERQTAVFPATFEELEEFDVIVMGDVAPQDLSLQQWQWIHDHVTDDGAGFVAISGPQYMPAAMADTPIGPLLPFGRVVPRAEQDVEPFKPVLTQLGAHHPLMRLGFGDDPLRVWRDLPPLGWYVEVAEIKPGAVVLAERPADVGGQPEPLIMLQRVGRGLSLFVGSDETWKWRYEVGNRWFYGFWAHAIQHVGMRHHVGEFEQVRLSTASETIVPNVPVAVTASIDPSLIGEDAAARGLTMVAEPALGAPISFKMTAAPDAPYLFFTEARFPSPGAYRLYIEGYEDRGDLTVEASAAGGADRELADPAVQPELLRQIAELTGGRYTDVAGLSAVVEGLDLAPLRYRWSQAVPLWDGWLMLILLAVLLTIEWAVRKWFYLP